MSQQRSAHIPFAPEDEFLGSDGQRIPPGFHWLPLRPRDAEALTALYAPDDTVDPEEAAINRMLVIDEELAELQAQHAGYANELQLVTIQLATSRKQDEMARLAALGRPMPTYCAPEGDEPWDGLNTGFLATHAMLDGFNPRSIAEQLEDAGYFALKSLRTKLAQADDAGLKSLPKTDLEALVDNQLRRARPVDPAFIDGIAEQLTLLTNPPKKLMSATRPAAPVPVGDLEALLALPMHAQVAAMSAPTAFSPTAPPVPTEILVEETLSFTLREVLRSVYRALHDFEEKNSVLVRANRAAREADPAAAENVLWRSFHDTSRLS